MSGAQVSRRLEGRGSGFQATRTGGFQTVAPPRLGTSGAFVDPPAAPGQPEVFGSPAAYPDPPAAPDPPDLLVKD